MKILAYDTSNKFLSVAVLDDEKIISSFHEDIGMSHSSMLISTIDKVLKKAHAELKDIDMIALGIGPGSFTGLRIGVSTAKALSLAAGIPVIGVPSLDVIAYNYINTDVHPVPFGTSCLRYRAGRYLAPLLDAKKHKVYSALYKSSSAEIKRITDYLLVDIDTLLKRLIGPTLFFGDGISLYGKHIVERNPLARITDDTNWYPCAEIVGKLGFEKFRKGYREDIDKLVPMYLHPKECNVKVS